MSSDILFIDYFSELRKSINKELQKFMDEQLRLISDKPFLEYYWQQVYNFLFSGGKRIRPVLMSLCYNAIKPSEINENVYRVSLSIELLHNASLIHDDIMDKAETRRGIKAFHLIFKDYANDNYGTAINADDYGLAMGILGGDFVYNLAYKALHNSTFSPEITVKLVDEFNEGFLNVVQGVIYETDLMGRFEVTEKEYFDMIKGKTAALFKASAAMGAILAEGTESQLHALSNFALNMGLAFQVVDDIIGTFGNPKKTGKPIDSDIKEGKKTLLLIKAMENADEEQHKKLSKIVGNRNATESDIEVVREIMRTTGAYDYTKEKANELFKSSIYFLEKAEPNFDKTFKNYLVELAKLGVHREK